jgi:hypothetical protein
MLLFVVSGIEWVARTLPVKTGSAARREFAVITAVLIAFFSLQFTLVLRKQMSFRPTAERLARAPESRVILVSADPAPEGMVVAEIAMRDVRPGHYVLRGSKVLAQMDWTGKGYQLLFKTPQEISDCLDLVPVDFILIQSRGLQAPLHTRLLAQTLDERSQTWRHAAVAGPLTLWERVRPISHGKPNLSVEMRYTFQRTFSSGAASTH